MYLSIEVTYIKMFAVALFSVLKLQVSLFFSVLLLFSMFSVINQYILLIRKNDLK